MCPRERKKGGEHAKWLPYGRRAAKAWKTREDKKATTTLLRLSAAAAELGKSKRGVFFVGLCEWQDGYDNEKKKEEPRDSSLQRRDRVKARPLALLLFFFLTRGSKEDGKSNSSVKNQ